MRFALYSETCQTRMGFVLLALSAIKTKSASSKCTYVLNGNSKSTGETAQARAFPARTSSIVHGRNIFQLIVSRRLSNETVKMSLSVGEMRGTVT